MPGRIIEIANDHRHLCVYRGFLIVRSCGETTSELGRIPLDDIDAIIAHAHGLSYTNNLLVSLVERGIPFVLCGDNHNAVGMLLPIAGNYEQGRRMAAQIKASQPCRKRLWAELVRAKLHHQAETLEFVGAPAMPLMALAGRVRSGDPDNLEAQGARKYWRSLFGPSFRRNQTAGGTNAMLNYGYTVLRAATARASVAAGLHPTLGLHHHHANNAMALIDDLMEPFRPLIDRTVWQQLQDGQTEPAAPCKRALAHALYLDMESSAGTTPLILCLQRLTISLVQVFLGERRQLDLPLSPRTQLTKPQNARLHEKRNIVSIPTDVDTSDV